MEPLGLLSNSMNGWMEEWMNYGLCALHYRFLKLFSNVWLFWRWRRLNERQNLLFLSPTTPLNTTATYMSIARIDFKNYTQSSKADAIKSFSILRVVVPFLCRSNYDANVLYMIPFLESVTMISNKILSWLRKSHSRNKNTWNLSFAQYQMSNANAADLKLYGYFRCSPYSVDGIDAILSLNFDDGEIPHETSSSYLKQ